jgi:mRNA interferase MazF
MKRGDIVLFDFPFTDRTGSKLRPALVVQADSLNVSIDDTVLALITRTRRGSLTEVPVEPGEAGIRHSSVVDCKNLLTADKRFIYTAIGTLTTVTMAKVDAALKIALGLA